MPGPGYQWIDSDEEQRLLELIRGRYLFRYGDEEDPSFKRCVKTLEQEVSGAFGVQHALGVSSGTAALITALSAAGIGPGDEVIVPGYTFIASISSIIFCNAVPVLAEVDESLNLDPRDVERKITPQTRAILAVHMLGNPCDLDALAAIAARHGLLLIEDAAQAFGGSYRGRRLGTIGLLGTYSFNIFKMINAGDGGMVVTDDPALYERAFAYHDQGHRPNRLGVEIGNRAIIGQNYRMSELHAAVLIAQFHKLERLLERLRRLKQEFKERIGDPPGVTFRRIIDPQECATILTVFLPDREMAERVARRLVTTTVAHSGWHVYSNMENILRMRTINPKNNPLRNAHYHGNTEYREGMLPQTDRLLGRAINLSIGVVDRGLGASFGLHVDSTEKEVDLQATAFRKAVSEELGISGGYARMENTPASRPASQKTGGTRS